MRFAVVGRTSQWIRTAAIEIQANEIPRHLRAIFGLISLISLLFFLDAILGQWRVPVPELTLSASNRAVIQRVIPGGAAQVAGLKAGDVIQEINGIPFDWNNFAAFSEIYRVGETIHINISRDGQMHEKDVLLVPAARPVLARILLISAVVFIWWAVSTILLWRYFLKVELRLLYLVSQTAIISLLLPAIQFTNWYPLPTWQVVVSGLAASLCAPLSFHYALTFSYQPGTSVQRRLVLSLSYITGLAAALVWGFASSRRDFLWGKYLSITFTTLIFLAACILLFYSQLKETPLQRRKLRLVLVGMSLAIVPPFYLYITPKILFDNAVLAGWVAGSILIAGLAICLYGTLQQNLSKADQFLNRMVVYFVLFFGIFILLIGPVMYLDRIVPGDWVLHACVMAGLILLAAFSYSTIQQWVQRYVDGIFYGGWYDYPQVIETVSESLSRTLTWDQLRDILTRQVPQLMKLSEAVLILDANNDQSNSNQMQPQILIPLQFDDETYATWLIGPRLDGNDFTSSDRRILNALAPQVEVSLSNILLVEQLQTQLEEIRASHETVTKMGHQLIRSREAEQARLSRELHDGPLQDLVGMNLELGILLSIVEKEQAKSTLVDTLRNIRSDVLDLMTNLRQMCAELRPPMLDTLGLSSALHALTDEWSTHQNLPVQLDIPPDASLSFVPGEVSMNLYRITQEGLSNIAHHAHASCVHLRLECDVQQYSILLTIRDDGKGFAPVPADQLTSQNHFGLASMQERVALIRGTWEISSSPGEGTTIRVTWSRNDWLTSAEQPSQLLPAVK